MVFPCRVCEDRRQAPATLADLPLLGAESCASSQDATLTTTTIVDSSFFIITSSYSVTSHQGYGQSIHSYRKGTLRTRPIAKSASAHLRLPAPNLSALLRFTFS